MDYLTYRWTTLVFYTTYISVDLAYHEIFRSKIGKGGIKTLISSFRTIVVKEKKIGEVSDPVLV